LRGLICEDVGAHVAEAATMDGGGRGERRYSTIVRVYKRRESYRADAARLGAEGWTVASVVRRDPPPRFSRYLLLGAWAFWLRGRGQTVVTYVRPW